MTDLPTYVRGDWQSEDEAPYLCARIARYWNGWAVPVVDRATLNRIVADFPADADPADVGMLRMDGDRLIYSSAITVQNCGDSEHIYADSSGLYVLDLGWCWDTVDVGKAIESMVEDGREHVAREHFSDATVDQWFRDLGWDPDASRSGW